MDLDIEEAKKEMKAIIIKEKGLRSYNDLIASVADPLSKAVSLANARKRGADEKAFRSAVTDEIMAQDASDELKMYNLALYSLALDKIFK